MYDYSRLKPDVFNEKNQKEFLKTRDFVHAQCKTLGAVQMHQIIDHVLGDSWIVMAYVDRLVELGEIIETTPPRTTGQYRIFKLR